MTNVSKTVREALQQSRRLRSRIAITERLVEVLRVNYMGSENQAPEMTISRDDGGLIESEDYSDAISTLHDVILQAQAELEVLDELLVVSPVIVAAAPPEPPQQQKPSRKGTNRVRAATAEAVRPPNRSVS